MRRALPIAALLALVAVIAVGLGQAGLGRTGENGAPAFDLSDARGQLAGAPAPLAALHTESNRLLPGGTRAFAARLKALRGHPVVVNKWASWCGPCRLEFPHFQRQATKHGKRVAFVGVNSEDATGTATTFLRDMPLPFPSYADPKGKIADRYARASFPTTVFVDERGRTAFVHQGQYRREGDLEADIERYLLR